MIPEWSVHVITHFSKCIELAHQEEILWALADNDAPILVIDSNKYTSQVHGADRGETMHVWERGI